MLAYLLNVGRSVRSAASELRSLTRAQRHLYVRDAATAWRGPLLPPDLTATSRIVVVCHGNIFRSPMAEALLIREFARRGIHTHRVSSAGLHAVDGCRAHDNAVATAATMGVALASHRARLLTPHIVDNADLIAVMDRMNVAMLAERFPYARTRTVLLGAFDPDASELGPAIADPYGKPLEDVTACYRRLERSVAGLSERLSPGFPPPPSASAPTPARADHAVPSSRR